MMILTIHMLMLIMIHMMLAIHMMMLVILSNSMTALFRGDHQGRIAIFARVTDAVTRFGAPRSIAAGMIVMMLGGILHRVGTYWRGLFEDCIVIIGCAVVVVVVAVMAIVAVIWQCCALPHDDCCCCSSSIDNACLFVSWKLFVVYRVCVSDSSSFAYYDNNVRTMKGSVFALLRYAALLP